MAAPADPTLDTLTVEALKKCGRTSVVAGDAIQLRAETWAEEIKNDIWIASRKGRFQSLQTVDLNVITDGQGLIQCPADFSAHISMQLLECEHYGVCQAGGSTTTAVLASDEDMSSTYPIGKELIVYLTATKTTAYSGYITGFNTTTKVATVSPAWSVSPTTTYSYMVCDAGKPIFQSHVIQLDDLYNYVARGIPEFYLPIGSAGDSNLLYSAYYLHPVPYRTDSKPWAIKHRYYANLMTLDLTEGSTKLITKIYREWRNVFEEGIMWKCFINDDDDRKNETGKVYFTIISQLVSRETGMDLTRLQASIEA